MAGGGVDGGVAQYEERLPREEDNDPPDQDDHSGADLSGDKKLSPGRDV